MRALLTYIALKHAAGCLCILLFDSCVHPACLF